MTEWWQSEDGGVRAVCIECGAHRQVTQSETGRCDVCGAEDIILVSPTRGDLNLDGDVMPTAGRRIA